MDIISRCGHLIVHVYQVMEDDSEYEWVKAKEQFMWDSNTDDYASGDDKVVAVNVVDQKMVVDMVGGYIYIEIYMQKYIEIYIRHCMSTDKYDGH